MARRSTLEDALFLALDDEYKARATYRAVIDAFGPEAPFPAVIAAEQRHVDMLLGLIAARGLAAPSDPYADGLAAPASIEEACRQAVAAEIENGALYDRLMDMAAGDPEVLWVFRVLRRASVNCHLSAFRRRLEGREGESCDGCALGHRRIRRKSANPSKTL